MSYELFVSLRYLKAKRKQVFLSIITFISIAGIFLGVAALIIVLAVMNGFETELRNKILGMNSHVVVMKYTGPITDYEKVRREVSSVQGVIASTPFIYSQVMLKSGEHVSGVVLRGLDPENALKVINLGKMEEGSLSYLTETGRSTLKAAPNVSNLPGIVVGKELSKNLGLSLFEPVDIVSPMGVTTPMGVMPKMKRYLVVGIFDSGFYEYDASLAYLSLKESQDFLNMTGLVTGIEIKIDDIYKARIISGEIERKLGFPFWVRDWMQMNKNLFSALKLEKRVMFLILALIVLVAAFNIITVLIMVVMEKNKDIAILKSMGATSNSIMKIFILQGVIIGTIGTIMGCVGGLAVALNLEKVSLFIEKTFGFKFLPGDVYYLNALPSQVNYGDVAVIVVATMLISFLATIYPSRHASRLDPAEALRYE
jgi:lipoprotein-releasing system permease protein